MHRTYQSGLMIDSEWPDAAAVHAFVLICLCTMIPIIAYKRATCGTLH
jgi:hypothetical protein